MTWFPDLGPTTMLVAGEYVRAVGWLHIDHPFPKQAMPAEFVTRLREFAALSFESTKALGWAYFRGWHDCEFCAGPNPQSGEPPMGVHNFGVPAGDVLYIAPEMISHYVERHGYAPPAEFVAAVMASPLPDTKEYASLVRPFRERYARTTPA